MRVLLVTPTSPERSHGNSVTARRWAEILRGLGCDVELSRGYSGQAADLLVALHARRSADSVRRFRAVRPRSPVVVALTGTDLYPALGEADEPVLELADRLVVLQDLAVEQLPSGLRGRARVIHQSARAEPPRPPDASGRFDVVLLAHLRPVKDPLLAAAAARLLPDGSPVLVRHAGAVMDDSLAELARRENDRNPHYEWLGELPRPEALGLLAASRLLLLTSRHEGGANAVSEALAAGVPVIGTRIPGTVGLLGDDYPGYFPVGDAEALAALLARATADGRWYAELRRRCSRLRHLAAPERERESWGKLLAEIADPDRGFSRRLRGQP